MVPENTFYSGLALSIVATRPRDIRYGAHRVTFVPTAYQSIGGVPDVPRLKSAIDAALLCASGSWQPYAGIDPNDGSYAELTWVDGSITTFHSGNVSTDAGGVTPTPGQANTTTLGPINAKGEDGT